MTRPHSPAHHEEMLHPSTQPALSPASSGSSSTTGEAPQDATPYAPQDMIRLCNAAGTHAIACTAAFIAENREDILTESAAFMEGLAAIWELHDLEPAEIWTEILRRIEVSDLFLRLNQPPHRKKRNGKLTRPWRVSTSKLP
ncbi:phosphoribosyl-ATP pyrophosphatase [Acetobacter tropicalis]|uniref:phosphoribosyl-ATP pyrophosphatase n=1 Tax=Acetobacter tropicalis TaxID=104102 RepID=UPI000B2873F6|nr:phosphoribosyl-ATP pyrophosphatase [Acetobacter tropicalis]